MARKRKDEPCPLPFELWPRDWFRRLRAGEIFENGGDRPVEVDLGCGDGGFLQEMAIAFPDRDFLGVERLLGRVRKVSRKIERSGLTNAKVLRLETSYAIEHLLPRVFADRVHLLFPDPWPKKKHQRRRLMCREDFLRSVWSLLKPGGELIFKTDHEEYFAAAEAFLEEKEIRFFERIGWPEAGDFYAETDFEKLWMSEGKHIRRMRLRRVENDGGFGIQERC